MTFEEIAVGSRFDFFPVGSPAGNPCWLKLSRVEAQFCDEEPAEVKHTDSEVYNVVSPNPTLTLEEAVDS